MDPTEFEVAVCDILVEGGSHGQVHPELVRKGRAGSQPPLIEPWGWTDPPERTGQVTRSLGRRQ